MLSVRRADIDDIELIRELTYKTWPNTYQKIISQQQIDYMLEMMYSNESLVKQMTEEACTFFIVSNGDKPVGFASVNEMDKGIWKLNKIYILPSEQGKGTGRFVMDFIVNSVKKENATALQLQVNRNNAAKDFYAKLGFKIIQTADFDIGNGYFMNDYIMELTMAGT